MGWDVPWILMLLFTAGQAFTILVLSIMLWRRRVQGAQCRGKERPPPPACRGKKRALGCEAEGGAHTAFVPHLLQGRGECSSGLSGDCLPHSLHVATSPQRPRFLSSNLKSRSMRTSTWPVLGEEQRGAWLGWTGVLFLRQEWKCP